ncbi:methyltransferase domain-containing protein [Streptomyces diastatochromogenes]|nr:methyltransferase domain-containing protein [Streptomyces diastatochromogenes]
MNASSARTRARSPARTAPEPPKPRAAGRGRPCRTGGPARRGRKGFPAAPRATVVGVDASAGMLARARAKAWPERVSFVHAPVESMEEAGAGGAYDAVLAACLLRNVADPDAVLRLVHRLLRPGGRLAAYEYGPGGRPPDRLVRKAVVNGFVRPWARLHGYAELCGHLYRSVPAFDTADVFTARLRRAGLTRVGCLPRPGRQTGITHPFVAQRA